MPKLSKSQTKPLVKAERSRLKSKKEEEEVAGRSRWVDDEARELDGDGILVDAADVNAGSDSDEYEADFIDDRDLNAAVEFGTPDLWVTCSSANAPFRLRLRTPPPEVSPTQRTPTKSAKFVDSCAYVSNGSEGTPELADLESMAVDDRCVARLGRLVSVEDEPIVAPSMYRKPAGVKAAALPPSLVTRSKRTNNTAGLEEEEPSKKPKTGSPDSKRSGSLDEANLELFMVAFMEKYMKSKTVEDVAPKVHRVDFDQLELEKGLAASRNEARTGASSSRSKAVRVRLSPDWDFAKLDADVQRETVGKPKDKGKGKLRERLSAPPEVLDVFESAPADPDLARDMAKRAANKRSQVDNYVVKHKKTPLPVSDPGLTISQYFKDNTIVLVDGDTEDANDSLGEDAEPHSTVFLEDLENYKAFYDPDAPCGVFDVDLQDPALVSTYRKLPPLPAGRQLIAVYDPSRNAGGSSEAEIKGGHAKFSSWRRHLKTMLAKNCIGAMLFVEASPSFINLSRVSPLRLSKQASAGASATQRLLVDGQIAVCLSAVFCTDSMVVSAGKIGVKSERYRKWISGIFHNQDWERFESVVCLVFGEDLMYTQINNKKAVSFLTMISPIDSGGDEKDDKFSNIAPADMFSP
ncbi:hypothetical protein C8F04DRAFT_1197902 [Mycena alexandri]|uniref:Uncharacterized protein n=1 Tax=Mycena alexandri TaxID=1745969 RepID=A0AAD6WSF6_9AGAR|nr:hypothetical protein C8F04DRAFT_1197902 [Mycena alexandri]